MKVTKKACFYLVYTLFLTLVSFLKLSCIEGTKFAFFSLSSCIAPISGFFLGTMGNSLIFSMRTLITLSLKGLGIASLCAHMPTLGGTLYLTTQWRVIRMGIPLLCILLFIAHPVGRVIWFYPVYWLPPVLMGYTVPRSIFLRSLASTLTAHAIGSVIWLYSHSTDAFFWHTLFSIVWIERLIIALCMTGAYYSLVWAHKLFKETKSTRFIITLH